MKNNTKMKILVYDNRKSDPEYFDASTPEKELASYLYLFQCLDSMWDVYCDLREYQLVNWNQICEPCEKSLHDYCTNRSCFCIGSETCKNNTNRKKIREANVIRQKQLYDKAKSGNGAEACNAARQLIKQRKGHEYENVTEAFVRDPDEMEDD
jgi:hypothetical protein